MKTLKGTHNVVGGDSDPKNLHAYGDIDGKGTKAKLQHPLGVHFIKGKNVIAVADTYNHKIKVIDPFTSEVFSWLGNGMSAWQDGITEDAEFYEPSGISSILIRGIVHLFIADCNNHCIRIADYENGHVQTCKFEGIPENEARKQKDG